MYKNNFLSRQQDTSSLNNGLVFLILSLLALLIRLPFFFRDYIDRDESTFILMGQSWVNGCLPYTELWDLKPPLVYLFFAGVIALFGKSMIAIRAAGTLAVAIIAFYTWALGRKLHSAKLGFWSAVGSVYLLSLFGSLQGVMSEHLSMLFFMPGLYFLARQKQPTEILVAGLLMGIAVMTKLNLAYAVALLGLYLIYEGYRSQQLVSGIWKALLFGAGLILIVVLTWAPYTLEGKSELWWDSVVLAPLEYTEARRYSVFKLAPIVLVVVTFLIIAYRKNWLPSKDRTVHLLGLAMIGVVLSFVKGGRVNGHYLIQFHPLFLLLLGLVLIRAIPVFSRYWKIGVLFLLFLLPVESYLEYYSIARARIEKGSFFNGEWFSVPDYLAKSGMDDKSVFFLEYHIGYWFLDTIPPTKAATHPSNLCRDELFRFYDNPRESSMEELSYIMDSLKPQIVVTRYQRRIFDKKEEEENSYLTHYLEKYYKAIALVGQAQIHRRRSE